MGWTEANPGIDPASSKAQTDTKYFIVLNWLLVQTNLVVTVNRLSLKRHVRSGTNEKLIGIQR